MVSWSVNTNRDWQNSQNLADKTAVQGNRLLVKVMHIIIRARPWLLSGVEMQVARKIERSNEAMPVNVTYLVLFVRIMGQTR
jgi:hypothetical protein